METLFLQSTDGTSPQAFEREYERHPAPFLGEGLPQLRSLRIGSFPIPLGSIPISNLIDLSVELCLNHAASLFRDLVRIIMDSPELKRLEIIDLFPDQIQGSRLPPLEVTAFPSRAILFLRLEDVSIRLAEPDTYPPFLYLTEIHLSGYASSPHPTLAQLLGFLHAAPALNALSLSNLAWDDPDGTIASTQLTLPSLEILIMVHLRVEDIMGFMTAVSLPKLLLLEFRACTHTEDHGFYITSTKSWNLPSLQRYHVLQRDLYRDSVGFAESLQFFGKLTCLTIGGPWDDTLFEKLAGPVVGGYICPMLSSIEMIGCPKFTSDGLMNLVKARYEASKSGCCSAIDSLRVRRCERVSGMYPWHEYVRDFEHRI